MNFYSVICTLIVLASSVQCQCKNNKTCIPKCCGRDEVLVGRKCSSFSTSYTINIDNLYRHEFEIVPRRMCKNAAIINNFKVENNASLFLPDNGEFLSFSEYCLEVFYETKYAKEENYKVYALWCYKAEELTEENPIMISIGMIISMPFLLATFIAYALLPDRNLHMKALMMYVINLMLGYLLLVIIQLSNTRFSDDVCMSLGYFCLFFFLVSFFWMNVICIDIWFTFSGLRGFSGSKKAAERKRFLMYCAYAWGMPVLHVSFVRIIEASATPTSLFKPGIGDGQCFLKRGYPELFYFYGPMAILITINIVFFSITAFKIRNIKKDTSMLKKEDSKRHSYENDKQTFNLYLKLLFAMGVNWSMEIISWAVIWKVDEAPDAIWYLTDFCNAIYGVFIFFIFVFKRSIWKLLKKRYYSFIGKPHLAHSMTMTNTTRVTSYSTANSSVHEHPHGVNDTSTLTNEA